MPKGKRNRRGSGTGQYKANKLSPRVIPFKIRGEIKALHSFGIKKPFMIHDESCEAFLLNKNTTGTSGKLNDAIKSMKVR